MLLRDLKKVYISRSEEIKDHGEPTKTWKYISFAYFNMQQDINELDRKTSGEVDYSIYKARTTQKYNIQKGDGVSLTKVSNLKKFVPDYIITNDPKIGDTTLYIMEKYNGQN